MSKETNTSVADSIFILAINELLNLTVRNEYFFAQIRPSPINSTLVSTRKKSSSPASHEKNTKHLVADSHRLSIQYIFNTDLV